MNTFSPELFQELSKLAIPTGIADYAALAVITSISATYFTRGILWDKRDPLYHLAFERPQLKHGGQLGSHANKETRNIAQKLDEVDKKIVVFWGSQSGTAEGFAHRLAREISIRWGQDSMAADLSDYDVHTISEIPKSKLAIFIVSTYGEGDPSDNTAEFWNWITKTSEASLTNLRYAAFGLGNSNYKFYNQVVDVIVDGLNRFKAQALLPVGRADDAKGGTEEDFMAWKDNLFTVFKEQLEFQEAEAKFTPTLMVDEDESLETIDLHHGEPSSQVDTFKTATQSSPIRALSISSSKELFNVSERNCLHVEIDLSSEPELTYKTGDHLAIWPGNPDGEVDRLIEVLGIQSRRNVPLIIRPVDHATKITVPTPTNAIALFRYYLEICAPVNRDNVRDLAQFAPTPEAKLYLTKLGREKDTFTHFISHTHLNLGRLLQHAAPGHIWSALPLAYLIEVLPHIRPRYYSISSSSVVSPRKPSITAIVSSTSLPQNPHEIIHGVTSNYLFSISQDLNSQQYPRRITYDLKGPSNSLEGGKIFAHVRRSKFKLPITSKTPLIMVAAGTGLAPFRAFLSEKCQVQKIGKEVGPMILFFGCRSPTEDFIYHEELQAFQRALGDKLRLVTAFSRVESSPRTYVQDRIAEMGDDVVKLLHGGASFYVCGRASMAREVEKAVGATMKENMKWSDVEVNDWIKAIKRRNKWQEDVWG